MSESELKTILIHIEQALAVYGTHPGKLTALEISLKSMLMVVRSQIADQLNRQIAGLGE